MSHIVQRQDRFYVVAYDGLDPLTGRERRRWHPIGHDRMEAELLATHLDRERDAAAALQAGPITFGEFLTNTWLPHKRRQLRATTAYRYAWLVERYIQPSLGDVPLRRLRADHLDHFDGVTAFITSSAPVAPDVARAFEARYGFPVLLGYGATEFLTSVTGWTAALWEEFGAAKLGSVGRAVRGVGLRVVDPATGAAVRLGDEGVLEVDPPQRAGNLAPGWLRTNDRARIDADGFLWILGRADDVIIRGGFKVDLAQVEEALRRHPSVVDALAVALPDERLGQVPAAVVVLREPGAVTPEELIDSTRDALAVYAVPVEVREVDAIPRTATMKPARLEAAKVFAT